jgi:hypothetical protein
MIKLPEGYKVVVENGKAVLAHSESKKEYVAWTKDINGGVCWGHYFSYYMDNSKKHEKYLFAVKAYEEKI